MSEARHLATLQRHLVDLEEEITDLKAGAMLNPKDYHDKVRGLLICQLLYLLQRGLESFSNLPPATYADLNTRIQTAFTIFTNAFPKE